MAKYFKKVTVDAIQYLGENIQQVIDFTNGKAVKHEVYSTLIFQGLNIDYSDYLVKENGDITIYRTNQFEAKFIKIK